MAPNKQFSNQNQIKNLPSCGQAPSTAKENKSYLSYTRR